jgi:hypothetical protein
VVAGAAAAEEVLGGRRWAAVAGAGMGGGIGIGIGGGPTASRSARRSSLDRLPERLARLERLRTSMPAMIE